MRGRSFAVEALAVACLLGFVVHGESFDFPHSFPAKDMMTAAPHRVENLDIGSDDLGIFVKWMHNERSNSTYRKAALPTNYRIVWISEDCNEGTGKISRPQAVKSMAALDEACTHYNGSAPVTAPSSNFSRAFVSWKGVAFHPSTCYRFAVYALGPSNATASPQKWSPPIELQGAPRMIEGAPSVLKDEVGGRTLVWKRPPAFVGARTTDTYTYRVYMRRSPRDSRKCTQPTILSHAPINQIAITTTPIWKVSGDGGCASFAVAAVNRYGMGPLSSFTPVVSLDTLALTHFSGRLEAPGSKEDLLFTLTIPRALGKDENTTSCLLSINLNQRNPSTNCGQEGDLRIEMIGDARKTSNVALLSPVLTAREVALLSTLLFDGGGQPADKSLGVRSALSCVGGLLSSDAPLRGDHRLRIIATHEAGGNLTGNGTLERWDDIPPEPERPSEK